jgi:hypothetical protein
LNTFGGQPLVDVRGVRENRQRFRRDMLKPLERANSFYCPTGRWGSRGWLLMDRGSYNKLNKYSTTLQLAIGQQGMSPFKNLSIVQAQCVTRGLPSDPNALYLIEVTDSRGILLNNWFQFPIVQAYNCRAPGYSQCFYYESLNGAVPWTWSTMLESLWNQMQAYVGALGTWPGLPSAEINYVAEDGSTYCVAEDGVTYYVTESGPAGVPEGFWFTGVPAWNALNDIVEYLGMTVCCDLTSPTPFTLVIAGASDGNFATQQTKYAGYLEDDLEWIDVGAARVPAYVVVLFRRRNQMYGTEEAVRSDAFQWSTDSVYSVTIDAPATFAGAVGAHYIWSDFTVEYDMNGNPLLGDTAVADIIAQERVTQYYAKIYRQTSGFMTRTFAGALPMVTGSQVDGVRWYQDYSSQDRQGWKTEIVRGPFPPWEGLWDNTLY